VYHDGARFWVFGEVQDAFFPASKGQLFSHGRMEAPDLCRRNKEEKRVPEGRQSELRVARSGAGAEAPCCRPPMRLGASRPALSPPFCEHFLTFVSRRSSVFRHLLSFSVQVYAKKEIMNKVIAKATMGLSAKDLKIAKHLIARAQVFVSETWLVGGSS